MAIYRSVTDLPLPELVEGLEGPDPTLRLVSAAALGRLGEAARDAVPALAEALQGGDVYLRRVAALALGDIGPAARDAIPALLAALRDDDEWVRRRAAAALDAVEAGAAAPALQEALQHLDEFARRAEETALALVVPAGGGQDGGDEQAAEPRKGKVKARRSRQGVLREHDPCLPGCRRQDECRADQRTGSIAAGVAELPGLERQEGVTGFVQGEEGPPRQVVPGVPAEGHRQGKDDSPVEAEGPGEGGGGHVGRGVAGDDGALPPPAPVTPAPGVHQDPRGEVGDAAEK